MTLNSGWNSSKRFVLHSMNPSPCFGELPRTVLLKWNWSWKHKRSAWRQKHVPFVQKRRSSLKFESSGFSTALFNTLWNSPDGHVQAPQGKSSHWACGRYIAFFNKSLSRYCVKVARGQACCVTILRLHYTDAGISTKTKWLTKCFVAGNKLEFALAPCRLRTFLQCKETIEIMEPLL